MRRTTLLYILLLSGIIWLAHCQKTIYTYDAEEPQFLSSPVVLEVTDTTATIFWEMDEACHAKIKYGPTTKYGQTCEVSENRQRHWVILSGLEPYTLYHYKVYNWDFANNGPLKTADLTFHTLHNEHSLVREGWRCYAAGKLDSARYYYDNAYQINPLSAEIWACLGWWWLRNGQLDSARAHFAQALFFGPTQPVALAGLATLAMVNNEPAKAIGYLSTILDAIPAWQYAYYPPLNHKRLRLQLAEAYFQTGQYFQAQQQLDLVWPANGLNPDITTTWKVNGVTYDSYAAALFAAIEYCSGKFAKRKI